MLPIYILCRTVLIAFCLGLPLSSFSQSVLLLSQAQVTSPAKSIKLNVLVTDSQNSPVSDVKQEEFRILEDGSPQTIAFFSKEELPLDYCLVLDTSGSVRKSSNQVIDAAQIIVRSNKPGDETSLIEFKDQPELSQEFTTSKEMILRELDVLRGRASRQSAIIDAVYLAAQYVAEFKPVDRLSRRALVVISDGNDNDSYYKLDDLRKVLRKENIQVFAIGYDVNEVGKTQGKKKQQRAIDLLTEISKETGGQAYFPHSNVELQEVASQVLPTLRTQFVIGYTPSRKSKGGSYHSVSIGVVDAPGRDKRVAITRTGYIDGSKK